ncbi:hypothetical protein AUC43_13005 [Hymenobacter sedentarius]|uniref:Uncharacterized protein n=1 Tax=Hymenobacter sedentarius TaxID=1411621 RepID=A0A0U4CRC8_9BACT|nr:hypothetical protein [Hymenobacter sedentarius]ALW85934.1 hypothetical protein AUC43_13005 [Hymenobacter sedentarius]
MNNTLTPAPLAPVVIQALHKRFQAIHPLLTGWNGFRRRTALESKRLGIRNACDLLEREFYHEPARKALDKAYHIIMDELNDIICEVEELAEDAKKIEEYGLKECLEILGRFAGYEMAVRTTYAEVLKLEAKYLINLRKNRRRYN